MENYQHMPDNHPTYGGFWVRFLAYILDSLILGVPMFFFGFFFGLFGAATGSEEAMGASMIVLILFSLIVSFVFYIYLPTTSMQATPGKRLMGYKIVNEEGGPITLGQSILRYIGMYLGSLLFYIGFIMIGLSPKKQGLHDLIAKTYVVTR